MDPETTKPDVPVIGGIFVHTKTGKHYEVVAVSKETESLRLMVTYRNIETGEFWSRFMFSYDLSKPPSGWLQPLPNDTFRFKRVK